MGPGAVSSDSGGAKGYPAAGRSGASRAAGGSGRR
ncbi:hypothetical protein STANM309S_02677 [Streptomyces tanashiensis]